MKKINGPCESNNKLKKEYKIGEINVKDKIVLDVGSDYGSTACIFINNGANQVISVDKNSNYVSKYKDNFDSIENSMVINKNIQSGNDWENLIKNYRPDVAQVDCEGCEISLLDVKNELFTTIKEYHIECHQESITKRFLDHFSELNYSTEKIDHQNSRVKMIWAKLK